MNLKQIMLRAMDRAGLDADDLPEYRARLTQAANTAYDALVYAIRGMHVGFEEDENLPLHNDNDIADIPEWTHRAICDYCVWDLLRSGGTEHRGRAQSFLSDFREVVSRARITGGNRFRHLPE